MARASTGCGWIALLVAGSLATGGCSPPDRAVAYRIQSRDQLIGGPGAIGDVNDYMLENDRIRVIIQDIGYSRGFAIFGGSIIDADLVRPRQAGSSTGSGGKDVFGEMFPAFFLEALDPKSIEIVDDGKAGGAATLRVKGRGNEFLAMTELMMSTVLGAENLLFETDYALAPGKNYVEITSRVINNDPRGRSHAFHNIEFSGVSVPIPMGDALLLSDKTPSFVPGDGGYDQRLFMEERYAVPIQLPALPGLVSEFVAASGDGVSYGFLPAPAGDGNFIQKHMDIYSTYPGHPTDHSLVIPFSASSLTPAFFANPPDLLGPNETFAYSRYLIVGSGDVGTIADTVHEILGDPVGTLSGRVREQPSLAPVANASVIIFDDRQQPIDQLDTDAEGSFRGTLRPGSYSATIVYEHRRVPAPKPFAIEVGKRTYLELGSAAPARLVVTVNDTSGRKIPARATLVGTSDERDLGLPPYQTLYNPQIGEPFRYTDMIDDTADPKTRQYIEAVLIGSDGVITGEARPGVYQVFISRGPEYSVSVAPIELKPDQTTVVAAILERTVDTRGYVSGDFHVHSQASPDSAAWTKPRLIDAAAEGLEVLVSTDHNYVVDYAPTIAALDLTQWLTSIVGIELTTLEMGHFNAYPLRYQIGPPTHGAPPWFKRTPDEIFASLRALGDERTIVQVNHPRDTILGYFVQYRFDHETLQAPGQQGLIAPNPETHPEYLGENFSLDFDALEILNGKRLDLVHDYRVPAVLPPPPLPDEIPPAGELLRNNDGTIAFPGAADDWMSLLEAGVVFTGMANSDSHHVRKAEIGYPRTYVGVTDDSDGRFDTDQVVAGVRRHDAVMSNCPFIRMQVGDRGIGSLVASSGGTVGVDIEVQTSSWCRPEILNVYLGKQLAATISIPFEEARKFKRHVELPARADTFVIAEVTGSQSTFPIVPGYEVPSIEMSKALSSIGSNLGLSLDSWGNLRPRQKQLVTPYALTNPIFIDGDGDGQWQPIASTSTPLRDADLAAGSAKSARAKRRNLLPRSARVDHPIFHLDDDAPANDLRRLLLKRQADSQ